ncbi:MAG TPA: hypothetical protein VML75_00575 [Kofleriaceae bacterium]|nr:hypothetical protein [Kofleriaceae bacterium]
MRRLATWIVVALGATTGCGGGCNGGFATDSCDTPATGAAAMLEIGSVEEGPFNPWAEGQVVPAVFGSQGGTMIPVALRLRGPDVPPCLFQDTQVLHYTTRELIDSTSSPVRTYGQDDGSRTTKSMYMIMRYDTNLGDAVRVVATAAGQSAERVVFVDRVGSPDAAVPDAGPDDAAQDPDGAVPADAAMLDAVPDSGTVDAQ